MRGDGVEEEGEEGVGGSGNGLGMESSLSSAVLLLLLARSAFSSSFVSCFPFLFMVFSETKTEDDVVLLLPEEEEVRVVFVRLVVVPRVAKEEEGVA